MRRLPLDRIVLVTLVILAYLPSLGGEFVSDDHRFIERNEAIHRLTPIRYFTDLTAQATEAWGGIYRPLRTLDFAIDWAISGGRPAWFHLRNVAYLALASVLLLALFRRILGEEGTDLASPAFCGALVFAIHPVHTESVAWISSRGDLLLLVFFLAALLLHVRGRHLAALAVLLLALLSKESAVVFPAAVLLVDILRRARLTWRWYAGYAGLAAAYTVCWFLFIGADSVDRVSQIPYYWGGTLFSNTVTVGKGMLWYTKLLVLPVELVHDYHVPARPHIDIGAAISLVLLAVLIVWALVANRRSRFALLWFAVTIFPMSNLAVRMLIPTAERFLLLPSVGFCFWAGFHLSRTRLRFAVFACLALLVFSRSFAWRSEDVLWAETLSVAETPTALVHQIRLDLEVALKSGDLEDARTVVDRAVAFFELFRRDIHFSPDPDGDPIVSTGREIEIERARSRALLLLGQGADALVSANRAAALGGPPEVHLFRSDALRLLGRFPDSIAATERARQEGYGSDAQLVGRIAGLLYFYGEQLESTGRGWEALEAYRESWRRLPDAQRNSDTRLALDRLENRRRH